MDTHTFRSHRVYMRAAGMSMDLGAGREGASVMLGSLCYRPFLTARDGTRGLYTVEFGPHDVFPFAMIKLAYDQLVEHAPILRAKDVYYVNVQVGEAMVTNPEHQSIAEELLLSPSWPRDDALVRTSNRTKDGARIFGDEHLDQLRRHLGRIQRKFRMLYKRPLSAGKFAMEIEFKITAAGQLAIKQARPWVY